MKLKYFCFFILICLSMGVSYAQNSTLLLKNKDLITGIDYKSRNYLVINGFDVFYRKSFISTKWDTVQYKHNELPVTSDLPYNFYNIKGRNYLVHKGCGEVYEFKNDSIIRIDHSFKHNSQYHAASFVYKDEIYFFGGYGMFTYKNILTKYDFKTNEWDLVRYRDYDEIPEPRADAVSFLINDNLYIISGHNVNFDKETKSEKFNLLDDVWKLNLKTKTWEFVGKLKDHNLIFDFEHYESYQNKNNNFLENRSLFKVDFDNQEVHYFTKNNKFNVSFFEKYNLQNNEIIYAIANSDASKNEAKVIVEPFIEYSGTIINSEKLFSQNKYSYFHLLWLLFLILPFTYLRKRKSLDLNKNKNCVLFKDEKLYHKRKAITNLSIEEKELLSFFFNNLTNTIQMNDVVDFIAKDDTSNYNTLTKKKDVILNALKQKLSFILEINEEEIFVYSKNNEDKRIKEIRLNPLFFEKE
jgi:hypothetical protein